MVAFYLSKMVMIGGWVGTEVKVDGMVVLIIRIDDVAAVVE
jgi:co-chaperonin GroES (HSP10)